jgi:hypothetical protein
MFLVRKPSVSVYATLAFSDSQVIIVTFSCFNIKKIRSCIFAEFL